MTTGAAILVRHPRVTIPAAVRLREAATVAAAAVRRQGHPHPAAADHRTRHPHHPPAMIPEAHETTMLLEGAGHRVIDGCTNQKVYGARKIGQT